MELGDRKRRVWDGAGAFARGWISRDFMNLSFEYNEKIIVGFKEVSNLESELHFKRTALLKQE